MRNSYAATQDRLERRKRQVQFNRELMPALVRAGVPLVVGTDSLVTGMVAGFALHDELETLVGYGVPTEAALLALPFPVPGKSCDRSPCSRYFAAPFVLG